MVVVSWVADGWSLEIFPTSSKNKCPLRLGSTMNRYSTEPGQNWQIILSQCFRSSLKQLWEISMIFPWKHWEIPWTPMAHPMGNPYPTAVFCAEERLVGRQPSSLSSGRSTDRPAPTDRCGEMGIGEASEQDLFTNNIWTSWCDCGILWVIFRQVWPMGPWHFEVCAKLKLTKPSIKIHQQLGIMWGPETLGWFIWRPLNVSHHGHIDWTLPCGTKFSWQGLTKLDGGSEYGCVIGLVLLDYKNWQSHSYTIQYLWHTYVFSQFGSVWPFETRLWIRSPSMRGFKLESGSNKYMQLGGACDEIKKRIRSLKTRSHLKMACLFHIQKRVAPVSPYCVYIFNYIYIYLIIYIYI